MRMFEYKDHSVVEILLSLVLIRYVLLALAFVFLMPRQEVMKSEETRDRGNIRIEIVWEQGRDVDVDLWVMDPSGEKIGWSHKNGKNFDLIRDDLGNINNETGMHYEIVYGRSLANGEYVINVHLYANREQNYPSVPVKAYITTSKEDTDKSSKQQIFKREILLTQVGEEQTIVRFNIVDKTIVRESINTVYKPIYKP